MSRSLVVLILVLVGGSVPIGAPVVKPGFSVYLSAAADETGITYHIERHSGGRKALQQKYSDEQLFILQELNRRDLTHLARADSMIVPDKWSSNPLDYRQLPDHYAWAEQYPKALILFQPGQMFGGYEHGKLVRWGAVSSGRKSIPTPTGLFHLNWKSKGRHSTVNPKWFMPWYFNFYNKGGLSLHQYDLPGYPASHSCVRLLEPDARWLFDWGEGWKTDEEGNEAPDTGTPFLIIGEYDRHSPHPWLSPQWAEKGVTLPDNPPLERHFPKTSGPAGP